jgi:uncharacterized BrkB/YihY/UPF0761 family membrane protein
MAEKWKSIVAKEWLTLVICLFIGLLLPLLFRVVVGVFVYIPSTVGEDCLDFLDALLSSKLRVQLWAIVLVPYAIYQFVRSIIWAVKALRA